MDHTEAIRMSAVERYLLNELTPELRDEFEAHYFECEECAEDLRAAAQFIELAKPYLAKLPETEATRTEAVKTETPANGKNRNKVIRFPLFLRPALLVPALAAMLAVIAFQNLVTVPGMKGQIAKLDGPQVLSTLSLHDGTSRGGPVPQVSVRPHQSFVANIDIPVQDRFSSYQCSLYTPSGKLAWQLTVPAALAATDAVHIRITPDTTEAGVNTLLVQGIPQNEPDAKPVDVSRDHFLLQIDK
jgi:hypothetical protein